MKKQIIATVFMALLGSYTINAMPKNGHGSFRPININKDTLSNDPAEQDGRSLLLTGAVFSGLSYGTLFPTLLGPNQSTKTYVGSNLLIGGGNFFATYFATKNMQVTRGMATGYTSGWAAGMLHGLGLSMIITNNELNDNGVSNALFAILGGLTESWGGFSYARKHQYNTGQMGLIGNGALFGGLLGIGTVFLIDEDPSVRGALVPGLALSAGGIVLGDYFAKRLTIAPGDGNITSQSAIMGFVLGGSLVSTIYKDFDNVSYKGPLAIMMATTTAGLASGLYLAHKNDYTFRQSNLIGLGMFAGGLVGIGATYLIVADGTDQSAYWWGGTAGAVGGFALLHYLVKEKVDGKTGFRFNINPLALRTANNKSAMQKGIYSYLVNASMTF